MEVSAGSGRCRTSPAGRMMTRASPAPDEHPVTVAIANVQSARSLLAHEGWSWFAGALSAQMQALTVQVMENELSHEERDHRIREYRTLRTWLRYPADQLAAGEAILEHGSEGRDPDADVNAS